MFNRPALSVQRGDSLIAPFTVEIGGQPVKVDAINTTNENKLAEYRRVGLEQLKGIKLNGANEVFERQCRDDEYEQMAMGTDSFIEISKAIAKNKARAAFKQFGGPILVEDTSLWLAGVPYVTGPLIKAWCQPHWGDRPLMHICRMASEENDRAAFAIAVLAVSNGTEERAWEGIVKGEISDFPRGNNGFGWDRIFIPDSAKQTRIYGLKAPQTWAEMEQEQKLENFPFRKNVVANLKVDATSVPVDELGGISFGEESSAHRG